MDWIEEFRVKRRSQFSTVTIFQTRDPKRLPQFIKSVGNEFNEIYCYLLLRGLIRVKLTKGAMLYEKVSAGSLLSSGVRNIETALEQMDEIFGRSERVLFIIQTHGKNDALLQALKAWIFDEDVYFRNHSICVFAENPELIFDNETLKYSTLIKITPSTEEERRAVLREIASSFGNKIGFDEKIIKITSGLTLHELESVALESIYRYRKLDERALIGYKYEVIKKAGIIDVENPEFGFEAVGGYEIVKEFIRDNLIKIFTEYEIAEKLGIRPPRGILLFGPPGTGKTLIARAMAKELGLPFLRLKTEFIVSKWYGETEKNLAIAIEVAEEMAPCIVFIDEIDRFGKREGYEHDTTRRVFSMLLEWLGDNRRKSIILGTTNKPQNLDEAFIRVGRFDYLIPILFPDENARTQIIRVHTEVVRQVPLKNVNISEIARRTEFFTGGEIEELVLRAARNALKKGRDYVSQEDFEEALSSFSVNLKEREKIVLEYLSLAEIYCNDLKFFTKLSKSMGSRIEAFYKSISNEGK
ncbi:MAG: ATP-binding protein [Archaeoglobaceae archaeon]